MLSVGVGWDAIRVRQHTELDRTGIAARRSLAGINAVRLTSESRYFGRKELFYFCPSDLLEHVWHRVFLGIREVRKGFQKVDATECDFCEFLMKEVDQFL